jgi:hypothetical protein
MADFEVYAFPNVFIGMGTDNEFVRDLQRGLGLDPSGVFDFLTMCYVVVHKHKQGLNYEEPIVDRNTWDSIFGVDSSTNDINAPEVNQDDFVSQPNAGDEGTGAAATDPRTPITDANTTTAEEQNADNVTGADTADTTVTSTPAPDVTPTPTAPNTTATDENAPATADPDTATPRTDANTTTAEEQQASGAPTPNTDGTPTTDPTPSEPAAETPTEEPDAAPAEPPAGV